MKQSKLTWLLVLSGIIFFGGLGGTSLVGGGGLTSEIVNNA